jgi:hypothetical protein
MCLGDKVILLLPIYDDSCTFVLRLVFVLSTEVSWRLTSFILVYERLNAQEKLQGCVA